MVGSIKSAWSRWAVGKKSCLIMGLLLHALFYIPYAQNPLRRFFQPDQLHLGYQGLDFYQIPRGAHAFWHGGSIVGTTPTGVEMYAARDVTNPNAYHPLTTLLLGTPLASISASVSPTVWVVTKLVFNLLLFGWLCVKYWSHQHFGLAAIIFLGFIPQYQEIQIAQYQWLLNMSLFFFLLSPAASVTRKAVALLLGFLIKPILLPWLPLALIRRQGKVAAVAGGSFLVMTIPFLMWGVGEYYVENLYTRAMKGFMLSDVNLMNFAGAAVPLHLLATTVAFLKGASMALILALAFVPGISMLTLWYCAVCHFLTFDFMIFEYHYTVLIPFFVMGLVTESAWMSAPARGLMVAASLPSAYGLLGARWLTAHGALLPPSQPIVALSRNIPILMLAVYLVYREMKNARQKAAATTDVPAEQEIAKKGSAEQSAA